MSEDTPTPQPPSEGGDGAATTTGMDPKIAGLLSYIVAPITGIIFYLMEKKHREVRFHAAQSILFGIAAIILWVLVAILSFVPVLGFVLSIVVWIGLFVLWIVLLVKGYSLDHFKLPVIGDMADDWAGRDLQAP